MPFTQKQTVEYSSRNTALGASLFVVDYVVLVGLAYGAICASNPWLQGILAVLIGPAVAVLFVVGHDAGHQSLTNRRWLNDTIGRLALLPSAHPYSLWILVHNYTHHRWTNLSPKDYVWTPLSMAEYRRLSFPKRILYRYYRSWAGPLFYYFIEFWIRRIMFPSRKEVRGTYKSVYLVDIALVACVVISYLLFLCIGAQRGWFPNQPTVWNSLLFGAVIPFMSWNTVMSFVIYLHHTHPDLRWYNDEEQWKRESRQSEAAVHVIFPGPINLLFHWIMEHNAHHARPSIPLYHLKTAQRELAASGDRVIVMKWTPRSHLDVVKRCKLYDYETARWMDFNGNYTSASALRPSSAIPEPHFRHSPTAAPPVATDPGLHASQSAETSEQ